MVVVLGLAGAGGGWYVLKKPNTLSVGTEPYELKIYPGTEFAVVLEELDSAKVLASRGTFEWTAKLLKYQGEVKPGMYLVKAGISNMDLVRKLRSGDQDETRVTFISRRTKEDLAEAVTANVMATKEDFLALMNDSAYLQEFGFSPRTVMAMFIPNTYNVFWDIDAKELFVRMHQTYKDFWTEERRKKAKDLDMTPMQVSILASIVQAETNYSDERPKVAGLYINRIKQGIPLQSDPTVIFAVGDFTIKRVLNSHLEMDSPYNTYKVQGLPPGPINCPDISSIDGVLDYEKHDYIFMCAKCDLRGHNFAKTNAQHERNAAEYRKCQFGK